MAASKYVPICDYLELKQPRYVPSCQWWVFCSVINVVMESEDVTFLELQSLTGLASQQKESLEQLGTSVNEISVGDYSMSIADAILFIKDQGTFTGD
jgi:hypothetical protein